MMSDAAATNATKAFSLPDRFVGGPLGAFVFSPSAAAPAAHILAKPAPDLLAELLADQESEGALLAALRVVRATLDGAATEVTTAVTTAQQLARTRADFASRVASARNAIAELVARTTAHGEAGRRAALRERAAIALLDTGWLDAVSQPATQPAVIVNQLFAHYWRLKGEGNPARSIAALRREALQRENIYLPALGAAGFVRAVRPSSATALHAAFLIALGRYPVSHLPELVGVHAAHSALGLDHLLLGTDAAPDALEAGAALDAYLDLLADSPQAPALAARTFAAAESLVQMELAQAELLAEIGAAEQGRTLDAKVGEILARHAPYAGKHHGRLRLGDATLVELLGAPVVDRADLVRRLKASPYLRPGPGGRVRFVQALKFGGPMFGIFSAQEAAVIAEWAAQSTQSSQPDDDGVEIEPPRPAETAALAALERIRQQVPAEVTFAAFAASDDRELLYRLVHAEAFPHVLPHAKAHAERALERAQLLFRTGAAGRFTDASWFDYSPDALLDRIASVYWSKLVEPHARLAAIPSRDEVIFGQKVFTLGSLVDGSWVGRLGNAGRYAESEDGMLFAIYADEMGHGDLRKNHITLIYRVLASLGIELPHLRDRAFVDQAEIPDAFYPFPLGQLSLGLFPDSFYAEIVGYNLGIEMFGLGEMRLHEIQKLRHYGFDTSYEQTHLSIDNVSAGHSRQAAEIIIAYLDRAERQLGAAAAAQVWRRVWNGYALFALLAEGPGLSQAADSEPPQPERAELVI